MLFNVPQYIDVEDKVAGPLTAKQLGWMMLMVGILVILWLSLENKVVFVFVAIPIATVFVALAFVRPYGQTLISLVIAGIKFSFLPKIYVWKRTALHSSAPNIKTKQYIAEEEKRSRNNFEQKRKALENLGEIARIIDSRGKDADSKIVSILKKPETKK